MRADLASDLEALGGEMPDGWNVTNIVSSNTFWENSLLLTINTTIIPMNYNGYDYGVNQTQYQAYFQETLNTGKAVMFERDGYYFIYDLSGGKMQWVKQPGEPTKTKSIGSVLSSTINPVNNIAYYNNSFLNTDVYYEVLNDMLKEHFILNELVINDAYNYLEYTGEIRFSPELNIYANGINQTKQEFQTSGMIEFRDANGNVVFFLPAPTATMANGTVEYGYYNVKPNKDKLTFGLRVNKTFLQNAVYPVEIDPTITFSTASIKSLATTPLGLDSFVTSYCNKINEHISFQIFNTNGTQLISETDVDDRVGSSCILDYPLPVVSITSLNSTDFVIGWYDQPTLDIMFAIYNSTGTLKSCPTIVDSGAGWPASVSVAALNSTHFVIEWFDDAAFNVQFAIYNSTSALITGPTIAAPASVGTPCTVSVAALNSTHFVLGWTDDIAFDATFSVYNSAGTKIVGPIDADTDISHSGDTSYSVSVATLNSTHFVLGWYDQIDEDITFQVWNSDGNEVTSAIDADTDVGGISSVSVAALNSTHFTISWYDDSDGDTTFAVYDSAGANVVAATDSSTTALVYQVASSYLPAIDIGFCDQNFVHSFTISPLMANFTTYKPDGTAWDGTYPAPPPENTAPIIIANATSPTPVLSNTNWMFNITATDDNNATLIAYVYFYTNGSSYSQTADYVNNNTNTNFGNYSFAFFNAGDILKAEYWVSDGIENTTKYNTTEVTVGCSADSECTLCMKCSTGTCINQDDNEDTKDECSASYDACTNAYTRQGPDGACDGSGACDTDDALLNVSAGNVCIDGADSNPTTDVKCGIWGDCIINYTYASEYWVGYTGDGAETCVDTDWQASSTFWNCTAGYEIDTTEHADNCSETEIPPDTIPPTYSDNSTTEIKPTEIRHNLNWSDDVGLSGHIFQFCNGTWNESDCVETPAEEESHSWANNSFTKCRNITILNTGSTTLTNFPAYINITKDNDMLSNYDDLRFYDTYCNNNGTLLNYEIENYTTTEAHTWVKIPSLPSAGKTISVYYKNNTEVQSGENSTEVWDSDFDTVLHLSESSGNYMDSSVNNINGTDVGTTHNSEGITGNAASFDGTNDYINFPNGSMTSGKSEITMEIWVNPDEWVAGNTIWDEYIGTSWQFSLLESSFYTRDSSIGEAGARDNDLAYSAVSTDDWHHITLVYSVADGNKTVYIDGKQDAISATSVDTLTVTRAGARIGYPSDGTYYDGLIDEFRLSNAVRSNDWINQSYQMLYDYESFVTVSNEESYNAGTPASGGWVNNTFVSMTGTLNWSNVTKTISQTTGLNYAWCIHANDTSNNWNSTSCEIPFSYVSPDTTLPIVTISYPEATTYSEVVTTLDYTVEETSPSFCWYSKDNGTTNSSAEVSGTNFTGLTTDTGSNTWTVYCNDTSSNVGNDSITFNMTEIWFNTDYPSTNKSFRITEFINVSGTDFTLAGEPYTFLGADSYYLADYATNHTYDDDGNEINNSRQAVTEILNEAQYLNINVLRTWASSQGGEDSHWEVNESGGHWNLFEVNEPGNYSEEMFVALDWVIYEASQRDIRLQLVLINNWNDYGGMRWYVQQSPTTDKTYENVSSDSEDDWWTFHDQFYTDENCIKYYEDYINYTLNRTNTYSGLQYKDDPAIFSWLLANEPRAKTDGTGRDLIKNWATNMTTYIKSIDSNHLVGLGIEGWGYEETWGEGTDIIADHETTGVDFATFALHPAPWKYFAERSEHTGTSDDWVTEDVNTNTYVDWWTDDTGISYNNRWTGSNVPAYTPALARAEYDNWVEQNVAWANNLLGMPILLQEAGFPTAYSKTIKDRFYEQMIHNFYNTGGDGLMFWTMNHDDYYYSTDVDGDMDDGYGFYVSDDDFLNNKSESVLDAIDFTLKDNDGGSWITFLNNYKYNFVVSAGTAGDKIIASSTLYLNISNGTTWYQVSYTNSTSIIKNEVYTFTKQFNDTDVEAYWIIEVCSNLLCINSTSTYMQIQSETPTITLLYPDDNINYDVSTLDFNYSVTTDSLDISNCGLYINDSLNKTDATITKDITQTFEVTLPDNHYSWYVKCIDVDDNVNDSVTRNLIIDTTPPVYSDDSTNSTLAGTDIEHRLNWYDNIKLDGYIFQFCNGTWNGTDCLGGITWANNSFEMCREIIVSNVGLTTLTNSPAYINLTKDDDMLSNYDDLMFYDALCNEGGTMLDYEIGNYTVTKADIWVRIPSLPAEGKTISVYYKNNTAVSSGENPSRV